MNVCVNVLAIPWHEANTSTSCLSVSFINSDWNKQTMQFVTPRGYFLSLRRGAELGKRAAAERSTPDDPSACAAINHGSGMCKVIAIAQSHVQSFSYVIFLSNNKSDMCDEDSRRRARPCCNLTIYEDIGLTGLWISIGAVTDSDFPWHWVASEAAIPD